MPKAKVDHEAIDETTSTFVVPEPTPSATKGFIGFVPVAEPFPTEAGQESALLAAEDDPSAVALPQPQPGPAIPFPHLCKINLRAGCYRITLQPKTGTSIFHGTMRVEKSGVKTVVSGDLYRFLNPAIALPTPVVPAASAAIRPAPSSFLPVKLGIPIYARDKYHSYLKVTNIKMPSLLATKCAFTITAQEYVYTQPPPGQFNGTFPPSPGTRTIDIVLSNAVPPPGYSSEYFEGKVFQAGVEKGTFKMGWVSTFFRKATVEVDTLKGAVAPQAVPAISGGATEDFKTVFKTAGWNLNVVFDQKDIPVPAGVVATNCWSSADLHALMLNVRNPATNLDKEWHFHLIVVPARLGCSRGIMYDQIGVPREGSASFSDDGYPASDSAFFGTATNQMQRNVPRAYLRSASHELGHGFNQIHQEQEGGADNSIMTTTPSVADVLGTAATGEPGVFPTNINLGFNDHVRHHLIHFPDPAVRPGGMTFGSGHSSTVPSADSDRHYFSSDDLELTVTAEHKQINLGEPLQLAWTLTNRSAGPIPVPNDVRIEALSAYITVTTPNGVIRPMPTFIIECESSKIANLEAGKSLTAETRLYWSSRGFAFDRPGGYVIEVDVMWAISGVPFGVKGRTDVWVNFPQSDTDNAAAAALLHPEVGKYVALGGGATHLTEAVSRLDEVFGGIAAGATDRRGTAPAAMRGYAGLLPTSRRRDVGAAAPRARAKGRAERGKKRKTGDKNR
ncbi:MAG TPA: hypothetical protein VKM94_09635 [Blastocatellia bacterium]|nr:hypothetical protein [Blastocatellia bacterium]